MEKSQVQDNTYKIETTSGQEQMNFRQDLANLYKNSPLSEADLMFNFGLYTRSSLLVKFIVMNRIYERVKHLPGAMMEFGVWYGQNLVLLENLRSIHEPFNKQRRIIGFDTFSGYTGISDKDKSSAVWVEESYSTGNYKDYLKKIIETHEGINILGHIRGQHELVEGDVTETVPNYFSKHPETLVAFAFFDMGLYKPTKVALEHVVKHSLPGTLILLDELTWAESPGEAIAFREVFKDVKYEVEKIDIYPSKALVKIL